MLLPFVHVLVKGHGSSTCKAAGSSADHALQPAQRHGLAGWLRWWQQWRLRPVHRTPTCSMAALTWGKLSIGSVSSSAHLLGSMPSTDLKARAQMSRCRS